MVTVQVQGSRTHVHVMARSAMRPGVDLKPEFLCFEYPSISLWHCAVYSSKILVVSFYWLILEGRGATRVFFLTPLPRF